MKLENVADIQGGYAFKSSDFLDSGIPIIRIGNLDGEIVNIDNNVCYSEKFWESHPEFRIEKGDILVAMSGATVGKAGLFDSGSKALLNQRVCNIKPDEKKYEKNFYIFIVCRLFLRKVFKRTLFGCAQPNISAKQMKKFEINVPALDKQDSYLNILDRIKSIIDLYKLELKYLDDLIKSRFVEMFGNISINDKGWDIQPLGELCTIIRGSSPRPIDSYLGGNVPWIKIGDATDGENIYLNSTREHIIQAGIKKSRLIKSGSLIFANSGSLGFARIITFDGCIHDGWLAMENVDERIDKVFLLQALNQMTEHFRKIAPAGTQPNLNVAIMKEYKQIIPPIKLQREFTDFVLQMDKLKFEEQKNLKRAQLLFDSLLQKYFE